MVRNCIILGPVSIQTFGPGSGKMARLLAIPVAQHWLQVADFPLYRVPFILNVVVVVVAAGSEIGVAPCVSSRTVATPGRSSA